MQKTVVFQILFRDALSIDLCLPQSAMESTQYKYDCEVMLVMVCSQ